MAAGEVRRIFRQEEGFDFFEKSLFALSTAKPSGGSDHERCERLLVNQDLDFENARHKFVFSVWAENWESLRKMVWASEEPEVELEGEISQESWIFKRFAETTHEQQGHEMLRERATEPGDGLEITAREAEGGSSKRKGASGH